MSTDDARPPMSECPRCGKLGALCVCDVIRPLSSRLHVLLLQHPQEPDKELGSARIAHLSLPRSTLRVGLSWPNLRSALGADVANVQPSRWAALYLGSGVKQPSEKAALGPAKGAAREKQTAPPGKKTSPPNHVSPSKASAPKRVSTARLVFVDRRSVPMADQAPPLDGIVILDGTWAQAKTLWWRNAWLLKLRRAVLQPSRPSLYGELRREPRRECLSTIESVAEVFDALGEPPPTGVALRALFSTLLDRAHRRPLGASPEMAPTSSLDG